MTLLLIPDAAHRPHLNERQHHPVPAGGVELRPATIHRVVSKREHCIARGGALYIDTWLFSQLAHAGRKQVQELLGYIGTMNIGGEHTMFVDFSWPCRIERRD